MGKIFTDLSYNNKTINPVGHPIDDLRALYKKKDADYNYVVDNTNKIDTALNNVPHLEKDKQHLLNAKEKFKTTFDSFGDALEDKIIDTKRLANDINNNYGLKEIQSAYKNRAGYITGLKERYDKGEITKERMTNALAHSDRNYKGIQKDEKTGLFTGGYSGRDVADYINVGDKVNKFLNGFKANEFPLRWKGQEIIKVPNGEGYMMAGTKESVTEEDLVKAAKDHLKQDRQVQEQFDEDIFYELDGKKTTTIDDVKRALGNGSTSKEILSELGVKSKKDLDTLEERLSEKGLSLEDAYRSIRKDQLTNEAISGGVEKESYVKYGKKYMKPLELGFGGGSSTRIKDEGLATITKIATNQKIDPTDYRKIKEGEETSKTNLKDYTVELKKLQEEAQTNPNVSQGQIEELKRKITTTNRDLNEFERQRESIKNFVLNKAKNVPLDKYYEEYKKNIEEGIAKEVSAYRANLDAEMGHHPNRKPEDYARLRKEADVKEEAKKNQLYKERLKDKESLINDAMYKYSQKDTYGTFDLQNNPVSSALGYGRRGFFNEDNEHNAKFLASKIADSIGDLQNINYTDDLHTITSSDRSKKFNPEWKDYLDILDQQLETSPELFNYNGKGIEALAEDAGIDIDDIDNTKSKIIPYIEHINGKPTFAVQLFSKKDKNGNINQLGKIRVNSDNPRHEDLLRKVVLKEGERYVGKLQNGTLPKNDKNILKKLGASYLNTTSGGKDLDRLNIRTAEIGVPITWNIANNLDVNIVPKKNTSRGAFGDKVYELQKDGLTHGINHEGKTGWYKPAQLKEPHTYSNERELRETMGTRLLETTIGTMTGGAILNNNSSSIDINKVIQAESNGNPNAVSKVGATGLMQIMPLESKNGSPLGDYNKLKGRNFTTNDLKNPRINKEIGTWYLQTRIPSQLKTFDIPDTSAHRLIAYNWGIGNLKKWYENRGNFSNLPLETQNYLKKILK